MGLSFFRPCDERREIGTYWDIRTHGKKTQQGKTARKDVW